VIPSLGLVAAVAPGEPALGATDVDHGPALLPFGQCLCRVAGHRANRAVLRDLVRLRINRLDFQAAYATTIRKHLDATGGPRFRTAAIAAQDDAHGRRGYSLWA
jgi:hypothetical protein